MKLKKYALLMLIACGISFSAFPLNENEDLDWSEIFKDVNDVESLKKIFPIDFNQVDKESKTAIYYGIEKKTEVLQFMIDNGADVNRVCNDDGDYPLHVASGFWNYEENAKLLVKNGAKINSVNNDKSTPLHVAAYYGRKELCAFYLDNGAKLEAKDVRGLTPFLAACSGIGGWDDDVIGTRRLFIERGANVKAKTKYGDNAFAILYYISAFEDSVSAIPPIFYFPDFELLKILKEKGVNINGNTKKDDQTIPLFNCVSLADKFGDTSERIRELAALGANLEVKNKDGFTPLTLAATMGYTSVVKTLLELGADPSKKTPDGRTLMELVSNPNGAWWYCEQMYDDIRKILLAKKDRENADKYFAIPEDVVIEHKNGKVIYTFDEKSVFEVLENLNSEDDIVLKVHSKKGPGREYICRVLTTLSVPVTLDLTEYVPEEFIDERYYMEIPNVKHIIFPPFKKNDKNKEADIYEYRLENFTDLEEVVIPDGIKKIQRYSFTFLDKLDYIVVPASVEEIQHEAFYKCPSLKKIIIKSRSTKIEENAIVDCPNAEFVYE